MKRRSIAARRGGGTAAVTALALALAAPAALAHGIGDSARDKSTLEFVPLGIEHMLLGWDHLLFIVGVVILAGNLRRAAKLITLFVAGHSLTLLVATLAGWKLSATLVDVVIALSLVFIGVLGVRAHYANREGGGEAIFAKSLNENSHWKLIGASIFGFGLIHGLGLSTRLQHVGLPDDGLLPRVIAFNIGVEIGQLAAIAVIVAIGWFIVPRVNWPEVRRFAFVALIGTGAVAAAVLSFPEENAADSTDKKTAAGAACEQRDVDPPQVFAGGHPSQQWYTANEPVPTENLQHVIGDGYVIVRYRPDIRESQQKALAAQINGVDKSVIGAPDPEQKEPVKATAAYRELTCERFDAAAVLKFTDEWIADVKSGRVQ